MANHLFDFFRARLPDAARTFIETADGRTISYGDLAARSARMDSRISAKLSSSGMSGLM